MKPRRARASELPVSAFCRRFFRAVATLRVQWRLVQTFTISSTKSNVCKKCEVADEDSEGELAEVEFDDSCSNFNHCYH
ncbi:hypothetical protein L596_000992 [Steinernema carpocapsae]|uniref:Uncharacterized protein n=1 Tax=Steinernema carpocapsae TaxID=34508 RepID=A0A4U8UJQ1_STECR|nr:hypothetical protein L596_000992 [Steinernema carpocapsae]